MANAHSFPLYRLPFLALPHIIEQMTVQEQLDLSDLSKRARLVVKTGTSKHKYEIFFICSDTVDVVIQDSKSARSVLTHLNSNEVAEFITKISGVFKRLDASLRIYQGDTYRAIFELVSVMKQLRISVQEILVSSSSPNDELCELALKAAKDAKKLTILSGSSPNFNPPDLSALKLERLGIYFASWFTLDHLLNECMNCSEISVNDPNMTVQDLNEFLKIWMEGSKIKTFNWMNTKFLRMGSILPNVLDGILCVAVKKARIGDRMLEFNDDACFMIERADGVRALVYKEIYSICMTIEFSLD